MPRGFCFLIALPRYLVSIHNNKNHNGHLWEILASISGHDNTMLIVDDLSIIEQGGRWAEIILISIICMAL